MNKNIDVAMKLLKKEVSKIITKHYSFSYLEELIEKYDRNPMLIGMLLGLLNTPNCLKSKEWTKLRVRFNRKYRRDIFALTGYDLCCEEMRTEVPFPELCLEVMGLLFKMGIINGGAHKRVAAWLCYYCSFPYKEETVRKKLEEADEGSQLGRVLKLGKSREKAKR